ncbi:hypothetical protein HanRHA438_Chr13g0594271 [Helianthus annuus]|nr:hypothetical protein HanRHA438_Chr13g0594271 [Helianthus annuus]
MVGITPLQRHNGLDHTPLKSHNPSNYYYIYHTLTKSHNPSYIHKKSQPITPFQKVTTFQTTFIYIDHILTKSHNPSNYF